MITHTLKQKIHQSCVEAIQGKINRQRGIMEDAQQAASEDTKSSAGDKFETAREMMKQEIQKAQQQLAIFEKMETLLMQQAPRTSTEVELGSLIQTGEGLYYFSISLGHLKVDTHPVYVLSMASPLGQILHGKRKGEQVEFRGRQIQIVDIL